MKVTLNLKEIIVTEEKVLYEIQWGNRHVGILQLDWPYSLKNALGTKLTIE